MATNRRELLGGGAAAALSLLPFGSVTSAEAQTTPAGGAAAPSWDEGELAHLLPTSSHNRILIKASFKKPLDASPTLQIGDQRVVGERADSRGAFWQFQAADLRPGTAYQLSLLASDGRALSQPWALSTMPAPDQLPAKLRVLVYSCAGGHDLFKAAHTGVEFLPVAVCRIHLTP
jgi:hypothetical protein